MKEETFNKIDSVYWNLEASKEKISYNTHCKEAQISKRSVSNYLKNREGRANITTTSGSGSGSGSAVAPSEFIANLAKLYCDFVELKDSNDIKLEEVCIIGGLIGCMVQECSNLHDIIELKNERLALQREIVRSVKNEIKQEGKIININR